MKTGIHSAARHDGRLISSRRCPRLAKLPLESVGLLYVAGESNSISPTALDEFAKASRVAGGMKRSSDFPERPAGVLRMGENAACVAAVLGAAARRRPCMTSNQTRGRSIAGASASVMIRRRAVRSRRAARVGRTAAASPTRRRSALEPCRLPVVESPVKRGSLASTRPTRSGSRR